MKSSLFRLKKLIRGDNCKVGRSGIYVEYVIEAVLSKISKMRTLLINMSLKKTGTTFLHNFFALNKGKIPNLVVPPIKEWYLIPRVRPIADRRMVPMQHSLGQRAEEMYEGELNPQNKEFLRRVANRPSGWEMSLSEVAQRVAYILAAYDDDSLIVINDPNFLNDLLLLCKKREGNLLEEMSEFFEIRLFGVHRNFSSVQISLIKMRFAMESVNIKGTEIPIHSMMLIPALVHNFKVPEFPVFDMKFVTSRTSSFVKDLFMFHGLADLRDIEMTSVENPNPAKILDYASVAGQLELIERRWRHFDNPGGIHEREKMSSVEYEDGLVKLYETWQ